MSALQVEAIRFWCGLGDVSWNYHPPETGPYTCISPIYGHEEGKQQTNGVRVPHATRVLQDSGAFSDGPRSRLSCEEALRRQECHAEKYAYADRIAYRASYDLLIDEKWGTDGFRRKQRWSEHEAEQAVQETVKAARFLACHRGGIPCVLSAQGVSPRQYLRCTQEIVPLLHQGDLFGLGGWCVTGKFPKVMLPVFRETMHLVIPFLGHEGIQAVHLWGVIYAKALSELLWLCDQYHISLSTDSMGPCTYPAFGRWGYAEWRDPTYVRPQVYESCQEGAFDVCEEMTPACRGQERIRHVEVTRQWLAHFRTTPSYPRGVPVYLTQPQQRSLWGEQVAQEEEQAEGVSS